LPFDEAFLEAAPAAGGGGAAGVAVFFLGGIYAFALRIGIW
jgi:hypothetical protein